MYELVTGQVPFLELNLQDVLMAVSKRHMRPVIPASIPSHLSSLMKRCWHDSPKARPSMLDVHTTLCNSPKNIHSSMRKSENSESSEEMDKNQAEWWEREVEEEKAAWAECDELAKVLERLKN